MTDKPIRILHVIGVMHHGGAETMIMNFYRHIDRTKVQFDFVENEGMFADYDEEIRALGGRIYHCPRYRGRNHFQSVAWWKQFLAEHGGEYKAVHGHIGSTAAIYLKLARDAGLYTIAHSHSISFFNLKGIVYQMYAYPTRFIADFFFGCSTLAGITRYGRRVCKNPGKFRMLNNAIETERFAFNAETRARMRRELGVADKTVIGHVGRFALPKNHVFLLEVFEQIHRANPDTCLLLVGGGELRKKIEDQAAQAGLSDSVIFAGVHDDVSAYYQAMDVFVLPSLFEGLGIVCIEAQTAGLPCVISDGVAQECIRTKDLVSMCRLDQPARQWAEHILARCGQPREDHSQEIRDNGFDIVQTTRWLENFYLNAGEGK